MAHQDLLRKDCQHLCYQGLFTNKHYTEHKEDCHNNSGGGGGGDRRCCPVGYNPVPELSFFPVPSDGGVGEGGGGGGAGRKESSGTGLGLQL